MDDVERRGDRRQFGDGHSVLEFMLLVTIVIIIASNAPKHGMLTIADPAADKQDT